MPSFPDLHLTMDDLVVESITPNSTERLATTPVRSKAIVFISAVLKSGKLTQWPDCESNGHFDEAAYRDQLERGYLG
jgi:hypothetical protein